MESIEKKIKKMIEEADKDDDGHINFLEFSKVNSAPPSRKITTVSRPALSLEHPAEPPKPPDGGWGWMIVFSCFVCNFIVGI